MAKATEVTDQSIAEAEERAKKRAVATRNKLNRDRAKMLSNVKTCIDQASTAIASGDVAKHDKWIDATKNALAAYGDFAALTAEPAKDDADLFANSAY